MTWTYTDLVNKEPSVAKKEKIRRCILLQDQGFSDAEIANRLGYKNVISVSGLRASKWFHQEAKRLSPKLKNPVGKKVGRVTADDHRRIRELHAQGLNNEQIAAAMPEWADSTIQRHIKKLGLRPPRKAPLSNDEKTEIIRLREQEEMSHKQIALKIGRPESTVSAFCVKHFGYTRPDIVKKQENVAPPSKSVPRSDEEAHPSQRLCRDGFPVGQLSRAVSQNGTPETHQKQQSREDTGKSLKPSGYKDTSASLSFHFRSIAFQSSPRRSPCQITQEVRQSLLNQPTFCDTWHAGECDVLETLVTRIRSQMGIPNVRELKRQPL